MSSSAFVELHGIRKSFGSTRALDRVDLQVHRDELLVVLGPTGAGKTTLLRTVAGLESPDAGAIVMDGTDVTGMAPAARDVALVFQNFSLYPNKTVRQNLAFPLRAPGRNMSRDEIDRRVEWAAQLLKISHLLDRPSTRLSGGEMQRVAIGRAIVRRPRVFLMDEPLTNLDAKLRESLRVELVMLRRQLRTPMIFVTHDQTEAMSMGDRIAVLSEGKILQIGTPAEIYRKPVSPIVARQLGQPPINLISLPEHSGHLVGVRPEDIALTDGKYEGRVLVVEDAGPVSILLVEWSGFEIHMLVERSRLTPRVGDAIFPSIRTDRIILWPRENS
jgi:multiple sugar transport system ATP-binding protein